MQLQVGENRVGISFESLMWFLGFTALGTVLGAIAYNYLQPYLPEALQGGGGIQPLPPSGTASQGPASGGWSGRTWESESASPPAAPPATLGRY